MSLAEKTFRKGEVIIKEGDIGRSFFRILDGKAGVYADYDKKDPFRLAVLEAGEYFGEMAIIETSPRSATVAAISEVTVVEIPDNELNDYFDQNPDQIFELMQHLGIRVQTMTKDYEEAKALLKDVRESSAKKNDSIFAKLKKHINLYQNNKSTVAEPSNESLRETLDRISDNGIAKVKSYRKGMIVCKEGSTDNCMYILRSGRVGMYNNYRTREEETLSEMSAVSFFGEMGMLFEQPRKATVVAETDDTVVESVYPEDLEVMFRYFPDKIDMILKHLSFRVRKLSIDVRDLAKEITETYNK